MFDTINLPLILGAAFIATVTPGPAMLAIAGTSMKAGRTMGMAVASGVTLASCVWSTAAAFGLAALMLAHAWVFEVVRYMGAAYLLYLAFRSAHSAIWPRELKTREIKARSYARAFGQGLLLHLTNPKAIFFFGSLYTLAVPRDASFSDLLLVIVAVAVQAIILFQAEALLFSSLVVMDAYLRTRRWFDAAFAAAFSLAGLKILTARIG